MKSPKFKIGDRVKVVRASTDEERHLWGDNWCSYGMDNYIGNEYTIQGIECITHNYPSYRLKDFRFPEFVLQNLITKGEQLLFEFMKD